MVTEVPKSDMAIAEADSGEPGWPEWTFIFSQMAFWPISFWAFGLMMNGSPFSTNDRADPFEARLFSSPATLAGIVSLGSAVVIVSQQRRLQMPLTILWICIVVGLSLLTIPAVLFSMLATFA